MKIYVAGYGHSFEQTEIVKKRPVWRMLISFFAIEKVIDTGMVKRLKWVKEQKNEGKSKRTVRRVRRTSSRSV